MGKRCPALSSSRVEPSVATRLRGQVYGPAPLNRSQTCWSISRGDNGLKVSPLYGLKYSKTRIVVCCSDLVGGHGSIEAILLVYPEWGAVCKSWDL
jgi:hypothetical protein